MLIAVSEKHVIVSFIIIFGALSFPMPATEHDEANVIYLEEVQVKVKAPVTFNRSVSGFLGRESSAWSGATVL